MQKVAAILFSIGGRPGVTRGDNALYERMKSDPMFDEGSVIPTYYQEAPAPAPVESGVKMTLEEWQKLSTDAHRWKKVRGVVQVIDDHGYRFHIDPCYLRANAGMLKGSVAEHFTKVVDDFKLL